MLAGTDVAQFVTEGYVKLRAAFPPAVASRSTLAADQLGIDLERPETWAQPVVRGVPIGPCFSQAAQAPALLEAIAQLVEPDAWERRPNLGAFGPIPERGRPRRCGLAHRLSFQPPGDARWFVN